ncbi:cytochrome P450 family protein [Ceratobasidium sp. AG-Ba]|nr:cytochrome P450 family protein [Ceratobasidium sp. AG-Ba]
MSWSQQAHAIPTLLKTGHLFLRLRPSFLVLVMDWWILPAIGSLSLALHWWRGSHRSIPLPPGPKGHLVWGNAIDISRADQSWVKFGEYADQYGPLVTLRLLHQYVFIISDPNLVSELMEKRAANFSDKRPNGMARLTGWDKDILFLPYGPLLKKYRTMLNRALNNRASLDYVPLQQHEVQRFMKHLVDTPKDFMAHVHLLAASIAVRIAYGHKVESQEDQFVRTAEEHMAGFSESMRPWSSAVNILPSLRYLPLRFPIFSFQRRALELKRILDAHSNKPFEFVKAQMASCPSKASITDLLPDGLPVDDETKEHIKCIAATLYGAGSDTTVSGVQSFFLAMTLYPDVQARAQEEIDAYMRNPSRTDAPYTMISPADRPNLPYTGALVRELLRWHPIVPLVGHRVGQNGDNLVVSEGNTYQLPAGCLMVINVWKIMHDPEVYEEPDRFIPERFLVENPPPGPENYAFGFGRRICPGLHVAQQSINLLANFTITKARDENGVEIVPEERYSDAIIR